MEKDYVQFSPIFTINNDVIKVIFLKKMSRGQLHCNSYTDEKKHFTLHSIQQVYIPSNSVQCYHK